MMNLNIYKHLFLYFLNNCAFYNIRVKGYKQLYWYLNDIFSESFSTKGYTFFASMEPFQSILFKGDK